MASWSELLDHDGYVVIELSLFDPAIGGRKREISSGYRADWIWEPTRSGAGKPATSMLPVRAPIEVVTPDHPYVRPGGSGLVHAHPFQPELWAVLPIGTTVEMIQLNRTASAGYTLIGEGTIIDLVDVPDHHVPLRRLDRPLRPGQAMLTRQGHVRAAVSRARYAIARTRARMKP